MGRRGRGPQDRGIEGSLVERTWARRARSGIRVRKTQEPGQALPGLWGALRKLWPRRRRVPRFKALPASGRGRGAHLRPPWATQPHMSGEGRGAKLGRPDYFSCPGRSTLHT